MYNDVIKKLLKKIEIIPEDLLVIYLMNMCNLHEKKARQAIYAACRGRACYRVAGEYIASSSYIEWDSAKAKLAKAFKVFMSIAPEKDDFTRPTYPWLLSFTKDNIWYQIGYIERGMEFVTSSMYADQEIPEAQRASIKRIAIVEKDCDLSQLKQAGFTRFCTVDEAYVLKIVAKIDDVEEAWKDVPKVRV